MIWLPSNFHSVGLSQHTPSIWQETCIMWRLVGYLGTLWLVCTTPLVPKRRTIPLPQEMLALQELFNGEQRSSLVAQWLRTWCCYCSGLSHCYGTGLIPGLGTSACLGHRPKQQQQKPRKAKKKKKTVNRHLAAKTGRTKVISGGRVQMTGSSTKMEKVLRFCANWTL